MRGGALVLALALSLPGAARAEDLRGAVLAGGTADFVDPGVGWWGSIEAWFGRHGVRVDGFGVRGAVLVEGSYQAMVGNAWPNLAATVRVGAGADVRERPLAPVFAAGGGLMIGHGLLPRPLAIAARFDTHLLVRDERPHVFVTFTVGIGAAF